MIQIESGVFSRIRTLNLETGKWKFRRELVLETRSVSLRSDHSGCCCSQSTSSYFPTLDRAVQALGPVFSNVMSSINCTIVGGILFIVP